MQLNALIKPLKLAAAISFVSVLTACSGNSSSTSTGPAPIIDPITVDKTISEVEWNEGNYVTNASHAYRVISKNSMLRYVLTNRLAEFDTFVNLLRVDSSRNCRNSGRLIAKQLDDACFDKDGNSETCSDTSPIKKIQQESQAIVCQNGSTSGLFFDGFFSTIQTTDVSVLNEQRTSTAITALGKAQEHDDKGNPKFNEDGDPILKDFTDYLFQSDIFRFFFDNQYESYVDFDTNGPDNLADLAACTNSKTKYAARQGMRSDKVGTLEGDATSNFYPYTDLTKLKLEATPSYFCEGSDIKVSYTYSLETTMANSAMGGGVDKNTLATWPNMAISLKGEPSGVMTLVHKNAAADYTVTVDFNIDGQVTVSTPDVANPSTLPLAEFLALSKPAAE